MFSSCQSSVESPMTITGHNRSGMVSRTFTVITIDKTFTAMRPAKRLHVGSSLRKGMGSIYYSRPSYIPQSPPTWPLPPLIPVSVPMPKKESPIQEKKGGRNTMPMSNQANENEKKNEENALPKPLPWGNRIHGTSRLPVSRNYNPWFLCIANCAVL